ncbi:MAG TPA: regulatory protein RecX [Candidatus Acidoferrales bacterium]|nr:regulatory protein RecX [Candidatus Acidoferrales bacterium]
MSRSRGRVEGSLFESSNASFLASLLPCFYASSVYSRSSPRKLSTEQELYTSAVRALMRRAHSIHQMREYLERRAEDKDLTSPVIAKLRERDYLDDARYALDFARLHANSRRQGRFRITRELRARGVPDRHIETALDAVFAETDEAELVRARLKRHLSHVRGALGQQKIASLYRSLLRAGFSSDVIRAELRGITHGDLPDPPDGPALED